jgi:hypothetical protein
LCKSKSRKSETTNTYFGDKSELENNKLTSTVNSSGIEEEVDL